MQATNPHPTKHPRASSEYTGQHHEDFKALIAQARAVMSKYQGETE